MKLIPLHDRVIIKRIDLEVKTEGGIILGNNVEKERDTGFGRVMYVGQGKLAAAAIDTPYPMTVKEGDLIAFNERIPTRSTYKGEDYYILRESDVFYIIQDENIVEVEYHREDGGIAQQQPRMLN